MKMISSWLQRHFSSQHSRPAKGKRPRTRLSIEQLEDRVVPSTLTVTSLADSGAGTLRAAITQADAASGPSTINFAVSGAIILESALPDLSQNINILGPGPAGLTLQRDASAPACSMFYIDYGETVTIAGLTMTGGLACLSPVGNFDYSACITANEDSLTVNNCVFANNNGFSGATILDNIEPEVDSVTNPGGSLTVQNSTFTNNSGPVPNLFGTYGGAIGCVLLDSLTISNCTFSGNNAGSGGAVWYDHCDTTMITGCTFSGNSASYMVSSNGTTLVEGLGGAIYGTNNTSVTIADSTFSGNSAVQYGGALYEFSTSFTVTGCTFVGNQATNSPLNPWYMTATGGAIAWGLSANISDCTFSNNSAANQGGALAIMDGSTFLDSIANTITDCTLTANSAGDQGGAIWMSFDGTRFATIAGCTIAGNSVGAGGQGSGIMLDPIPTGTLGTVTLLDSIIAGNFLGSAAGDDADMECNATNMWNIGQSAYNLIGSEGGDFDLPNGVNGNIIGAAANPINPLLGPLQNNGGPTQTMALLPGSSALNAGSASGAPTTDQRGLPRVVNGLIDIGAWQHQPPTIVQPASATPNPVTGTTASLSVLGVDDAGEAGPTYTWSVTSAPAGAPTPTFSANGTPAAANTTVTFGQAGTYIITATIKDPLGLTASSSVTVTVGVATTPAAPTGLTAAPGNSQVSLSWNASSSAASYNLYRGTSSGGETLVASGITGTSYTDTGRTNGDNYYYKVTAVNSAGASGFSNEATAWPQAPGGIIWVEDSTPVGAALASDGGDAWNWSGSSPAPYSGSQDQQSTAASGEHQHYFYNANQTMTVGSNDTLYAYVYLNPSNPPQEIMLQWNVGGSWEHRAYWGANDIGWGTDGTVSRQYMGALPATGGWIRLAVPASAVGLGGTTVSGMAFTLYGGQADFDQAGVVSAPAAPSGLTATAGNGQVALNWTASSGASSYKLYRSTSSGTELLVASGVTGTSYMNIGLSNGTTYYYEVTAVNSNGESAMSNQVSATPQAASTVSAAFVKNDAATQGTWSSAYGADGYDISQYGASLPSYATVNITGNANYVWNGSTSDGRALQEPGSSNRLAACWYSGSSFTIDVNLTDGQTHQVALYALDWDSYGPRQEQINVRDAGTGQVLNSQTVSSFSGGQYLVWNISGHVQFQVTNLVGGSNAVISGLFFGPGSAPAAPTGLTASAGNAQVSLTWTASSGASSYNLYRSTTSGTEQLVVAGITGTSYTNTELTNGSTYYYEVTAVNGNGESALSNEVSATPQAVTTNTLADAGFESPNVGTGSWGDFVYDPSGVAWNFSGNAGVAGNGSGFTSGNPNAPEGTQVGFLQTTGSISQTVNLSAGTYTLDFLAAQRANYGGAQSFEVLVDGVVVGTFANLSTSYTPLSTAPFTVTAGLHTITFQGLDPNGGDDTAFIDQVSLNPFV